MYASPQTPWLALLYQGYWTLQFLRLTCGDARLIAEEATRAPVEWYEAEWIVTAALMAINYAIGVAGSVSMRYKVHVAAATYGTLGAHAAVLVNEVYAVHGEAKASTLAGAILKCRLALPLACLVLGHLTSLSG